jgi:hypothetical protein
MKRLIIGGVLALTPLLSHAEWRETCEAMSGVAKAVMGARQSGAPMPEVMNVIKVNDNKIAKDFAEELIIMAYDRPRFDTQEYQQQMINNFTDSVYLQCVKALRK